MTEILYDLIYMFSVSILGISFCAGYIGAPEKRIFVYLVAAASLAICLVMKYWESLMKYLLPGLPLTIAAGIILIRKPEERLAFMEAQSWILWAALLTVAFFLVTGIVISHRWSKRVFAILLCGLLGVMMSTGFGETKEGTVLAILPILMTVVEEIQAGWEKSGYTQLKGHLVSIAPFLLAAGLIVFVIPAPEKPYDWSFAVRLWQRIEEGVRFAADWFNIGDEDYGGEIGFSDTSSFLGALTKQRQDLLEVTVSRDAGQIVYLVGKNFDTFDGRHWTSTFPAGESDRFIETLETICAVNAYDPDYFTNYLNRIETKVKYLGIRTKYAFLPGKALPQQPLLESLDLRAEGGGLMSSKQFRRDTQYPINYYRLNKDREEFREFVANAGEITKEQWTIDVMRHEDTRGAQLVNPPTSYEDYLEYRKHIYEYDLPETKVSPEMEEFLAELLEGTTNDMEKLSRVEAYLGSFEYNEKPGELPESVDSPAAFLDRLIFEEKQGYCSHYATAFVLIARYLGIPARYVQGFYIDRGAKTQFTVTSDMAHAWPEAYLDGVGWISFEPTPGKKYVSAWAWKVKKEDGPKAEEDHSQEEEESPFATQNEEDEQQEEGEPFDLRVILIPLGLCILFLVLFVSLDRVLAASWYRKLSDREKFFVASRRNLRILSILGLSIESGETLEEFADRAKEKVPDEALGFLASLELAYYAQKQAGAEMLAEAEKQQEILLSLLKEEKGKWYFWYCFRIFRIDTKANRAN